MPEEPVQAPGPNPVVTRIIVDYHLDGGVSVNAPMENKAQKVLSTGILTRAIQLIEKHEPKQVQPVDAGIMNLLKGIKGRFRQ